MTSPNEAPAAISTRASVSAITMRPRMVAARLVILLARDILLDYLRSGWILVELAYVLALYLFAFGYPFEPPFFFESANWGLGLLAIFATLLLVARAMRPAVARPAIAHASQRIYIAGLMLAAAVLRLVAYLALLALVLLSHRLINATGGALLAGTLGLFASCIVLAALALALSPAFAPLPRAAQPSASLEKPGEGRGNDSGDLLSTLWRLRHLVVLAWLTAALYSYSATNALAAIFFAWRLPLLPLFACYAMGITGAVGWGGLLSLIIDAAYVVGLALLADYWHGRWNATPVAMAATAESTGVAALAPVPAPTSAARNATHPAGATPSPAANRPAPAQRSRPRNHSRNHTHSAR